jgi:hypothetical protein
VQYADSDSNGQVDYVDEAQIYEDEHGNERQERYEYDGTESYGQGSKEYYNYHENRGHDSRGDRRHDDGQDDMW